MSEDNTNISLEDEDKIIILEKYRNSLYNIFNRYYPGHRKRNAPSDSYSTFSNKYIIVSSIHGKQDLCFNAGEREILYAIQECFKKELTRFSESCYGKALIIPFKYVTINPPFENIMQYFIKHFLIRLELIDNFLIKKKPIIDNSVNSHLLLIPERIPKLIAEKKELYKTTFAYNALYIRKNSNIPNEILGLIFEFLYEPDIVKCMRLRIKYENLRADINTYGLLTSY